MRQTLNNWIRQQAAERSSHVTGNMALKLRLTAGFMDSK
jgi:hypothetical protein